MHLTPGEVHNSPKAIGHWCIEIPIDSIKKNYRGSTSWGVLVSFISIIACVHYPETEYKPSFVEHEVTRMKSICPQAKCSDHIENHEEEGRMKQQELYTSYICSIHKRYILSFGECVTILFCDERGSYSVMIKIGKPVKLNVTLHEHRHSANDRRKGIACRNAIPKMWHHTRQGGQQVHEGQV